MEKKNIMDRDSVLPENFDGTFRFTNWTDEEFVGKWGGKEYHFAALSTAPMIMPEFTPLEVQYIRKKFAKDLAEREYFNSKGYKNLRKQEVNSDGTARLNSMNQAGTYSLNELSPFIQKALEPLEISKILVTKSEKASLESTLSRNESGELNSTVIKASDSLRKKALEA